MADVVSQPDADPPGRPGGAGPPHALAPAPTPQNNNILTCPQNFGLQFYIAIARNILNTIIQNMCIKMCALMLTGLVILIRFYNITFSHITILSFLLLNSSGETLFTDL